MKGIEILLISITKLAVMTAGITGTRNKKIQYIILTISIGENLFQGCGIRSPQNSQHCELICLTIRGHTVVKSLQKEDINFYLSAVLQFLKSAYN